MKSFTDIDDLKKTIPAKVINQLKALLKDSGLPDNENSLIKIIESWLLKQAMFNKIIEHGEFKVTDKFNKDFNGGCIAVTLSGSILSIGPKSNEKRKAVYTSIDFRKDVPKILEEDNAVLAEDIVIGKPARFTTGKLKSTSEIYNLCLPEIEGREEEEVNKIIEINKLLLNNFLQVDNYTFKSNYFDNELAYKNELFNKWIIINWFIIGGFEKHIFIARVKILWLELFSRLYKEILKDKKFSENPEKYFLDFTNLYFTKYIDDYKWYESEKKNFDIGLFKALEEIPAHKNYWDCMDKYLNEIKRD